MKEPRTQLPEVDLMSKRGPATLRDTHITQRVWNLVCYQLYQVITIVSSQSPWDGKQKEELNMFRALIIQLALEVNIEQCAGASS